MKKLSAYIYPLTIRQKAKSSADHKGFSPRLLRLSLLFHYLFYCLRHLSIPWHYFQLNGSYFNEEKGIFSKLDIDKLIPGHWRLSQHLYRADTPPKNYPVFLKPEWGQNSNGITRIDSVKEYLQFAQLDMGKGIAYLVQEPALGKKEYEIYYLRTPKDKKTPSFFSVTEVANLSEQRYPVNSIHNRATRYSEVTMQMSQQEREQLWNGIEKIGDFRMARIGVKADSLSSLLKGEFKIIEINLFLPMPLVLLTDNVVREEKQKIIRRTMSVAAQLVKEIPPEETGKRIFFRKMRAHYKTAK